MRIKMYGYIVWFDDELNYIIGVIKYMNVWAALAAGASYIIMMECKSI